MDNAVNLMNEATRMRLYYSANVVQIKSRVLALNSRVYNFFSKLALSKMSSIVVSSKMYFKIKQL